MDGFTAAHAVAVDPTGRRAMDFYGARDLPFYHGLYSNFAIGDRYFASVPGPTFPNREYLLAGTSFGHIRNDLPADGLPGMSVSNELDAAGRLSPSRPAVHGNRRSRPYAVQRRPHVHSEALRCGGEMYGLGGCSGFIQAADGA